MFEKCFALLSNCNQICMLMYLRSKLHYHAVGLVCSLPGEFNFYFILTRRIISDAPLILKSLGKRSVSMAVAFSSREQR
jgi:hypothetical protein